MIPPSDPPHAMTRFGFAKRWLNRSSSATWSLNASWSAQPVELYDEPAIAYPWPSSHDEMLGAGVSVAVEEERAVPARRDFDSVLGRADAPRQRRSARRWARLRRGHGGNARRWRRAARAEQQGCGNDQGTPHGEPQMLDRDCPPSTAMHAPFKRLACCEHTNVTTLAISSTAPNRPSGISERT